MSNLFKSFSVFMLSFLISCVFVFLMTAVVAEIMPTPEELEPLAQVIIDKVGL